jgi:chromosome segregation ATPase
MRTLQIRRLAALVMCLGTLAWLVGCGGDGGRAAESEKAVGSMQDTKAQITNAKQLVTKANTSLDQLSAGGDLNKSYGSFSKAVDDLQSSGERVKARWADMQARGKQYQQKWQTEAANIKNPEIRQSLEARREKVRQNYDKITATAKGAKEAWDPYMSDVQEIKKALAIDLTPGAVQAMKPTFDKAKVKGATLIQQLDALDRDLAEVMGGMTPETQKK